MVSVLLQWIAAAWTRRAAIASTAETAVELVQELDKIVHPGDTPHPVPFSEVERMAAQRDAATAFKVPAPAPAEPLESRPEDLPVVQHIPHKVLPPRPPPRKAHP